MRIHSYENTCKSLLVMRPKSTMKSPPTSGDSSRKLPRHLLRIWTNPSTRLLTQIMRGRLQHLSDQNSESGRQGSKGLSPSQSRYRLTRYVEAWSFMEGANA